MNRLYEVGGGVVDSVRVNRRRPAPAQGQPGFGVGDDGVGY
jgi:hypothetical protein